MPAIKSLPCPRCSSPMRRGSHSSGNAAGLAMALIVFVVGLLITLLIPILGWFLGPVICVCALFIGGKRTKVWRCKPCGFMTPINSPTSYVAPQGATAPATAATGLTPPPPTAGEVAGGVGRLLVWGLVGLFLIGVVAVVAMRAAAGS